MKSRRIKRQIPKSRQKIHSSSQNQIFAKYFLRILYYFESTYRKSFLNETVFIFQIKEKHHNKLAERKKPKTVCHLLSIDCAYNIEYMTEYMEYQMEMIENKKLSSSFLKNGICVDQRKLIVKFFIESAVSKN